MSPLGNMKVLSVSETIYELLVILLTVDVEKHNMEKSEKEMTSSKGTLGGFDNEESLLVSFLYILGHDRLF